MKIICIGRNYAEHAAELHEQLNDSGKLPEEPMFFLKPDTALLRNNDPFYLPSFSQEVHYECELVVRINRVGKAIAERFAHRYYDEVGLGIDFTARDLQRRAIAEGLPWESCKAFDRSAAISPEFVSLQELGGDVQRLHFTLDVNGERRQRGDTAEMLFTVDRIIATVSRYMTLRMGDLLYTGTPAGVGPVRPGDTLRAALEGRETVKFRHQMNLEKRLFRNRKKAEPLRKTFHLSPLTFHLYTCCSTTNSNPTACCWRRSRRGGGS